MGCARNSCPWESSEEVVSKRPGVGYCYSYQEVDLVTLTADMLSMHVLHHPVGTCYFVLVFQVGSTQSASPKGHGGKEGVDCLLHPWTLKSP